MPASSTVIPTTASLQGGKAIVYINNIYEFWSTPKALVYLKWRKSGFYRDKGFTLIELLVVISIIAILSAVGLVTFTNVRKSAQDAKIKSDINAIKKAYESNYDPTLNGGQGGYKRLLGSNFADGKIPTKPDGTQYSCSIGPDPAPTSTNYGCTINPSSGNAPVGVDPSQGYSVSGTTSTGVITVSSNQGSLNLSSGVPLPVCPNMAGLIGHWKFDNGSVSPGNSLVVTDSISGRNGNWTLLSNGRTSQWSSQGKFSYAGNFGGTTSAPNIVTIPDNNVFSFSNNFTLSAWVKLNNTGVKQLVINKWVCGGTQLEYQLGVDSGNRAFIIFSNGTGAYVNATGTNNLSTGIWYHLVGTYDGTKLVIYVDGNEERRTSTTSSMFNSTANLTFGAGEAISSNRNCEEGSTTISRFTGLIDDVKIYNQALSSSNILTLASCQP